MDFCCVRLKSRHAREKHDKKETRKGKERSSPVWIEAQPRSNPSRKKKKRGKQTHRRSKTMAHPQARLSRAEFPAPDHRQPCRCVACCASLASPPTGSSNYGNEPYVGQSVSPSPSQESPQRSAPVNQLYVHPYSTYHYRFPVVDHSTVCHGPRPAPYPAFYMALVPEVVAIRDIETALAHHPGLEIMVRLSATEELVRISTFHCIRVLYEASLQLEVWDRDDGVENAWR